MKKTRRIAYVFGCWVLSAMAHATLWTPDQKLHPQVLSIFHSMGYPVDGQISVAALNNFAQKRFLRPKGSNRLDPAALNFYQNLYEGLGPDKEQVYTTIMNAFKSLGDLEEALPPLDFKPKFIAVQGSTLSNMARRLRFLERLFEDNPMDCNNATIYLLVGERELFPDEATRDVWRKLDQQFKDPNLPLPTISDECEAARWLIDHLKVVAPGLAGKEIVLLCAKKKKGSYRAQTEDCGSQFFKKISGHGGGDILVISSNPFVYYQTQVLNLALQKSKVPDKNAFRLAGAGAQSCDKVSNAVHLGRLLDNLARTLYVENQMQARSTKQTGA